MADNQERQSHKHTNRLIDETSPIFCNTRTIPSIGIRGAKKLYGVRAKKTNRFYLASAIQPVIGVM